MLWSYCSHLVDESQVANVAGAENASKRAMPCSATSIGRLLFSPTSESSLSAPRVS